MKTVVTGVALFFLTLLLALMGYIFANQQPDHTVAELSERWAKPPSQFIEVAGMQVHLRDEGSSERYPPIVLLHGTSASLHTWDGWVDELKNDHRVVRFDLPAFGLTGPEPNNDYRIENYAKFVVETLDKLGLEKVILGGNSLGGYISWATAVLYPERVSHLVLVDPSGYPLASKSVPIAFKIAQTPILNSVLNGFMPRALVKSSIEDVYGDPSLVTDELVDRYFELNTREGNRQALKARFEQTSAGEMARRSHEIAVPTLIIWGEKDALIPPSTAVRFQQDIANTKLVLFESLGHVPHEEDPISTVNALKTFLAEQN
ncbi:alpha/beta hydrolase [Aliiglaciecola litoralis]|uniref:Alpha/beta hydrolase n=1 Tax=Aliiglaciecola litoralis TaxID=582857 RepID=A0ABN1LL08_9ALTE